MLPAIHYDAFAATNVCHLRQKTDFLCFETNTAKRSGCFRVIIHICSTIFEIITRFYAKKSLKTHGLVDKNGPGIQQWFQALSKPEHNKTEVNIRFLIIFSQ